MEDQEALAAGQTVAFRDLPNQVPALPPGRVERIVEGMVHIILDEEAEGLDPRLLLRSEISMVWPEAASVSGYRVVVEKLDGQAMWLRVTSSQNREFQRLSARLRLVYYTIAPDALEKICEEALSVTPSRDDMEIEVDKFWHSDDLGEQIGQQFAQLARYLHQVDSKLDYLIALAEGRTPSGPVPREATLYDISGGGLSFFGPEAIEPGAHIHLRLQLSQFPLTEVVGVAKVKRSNPVKRATDERAHYIGANFECIHDDEREKIFRFISRLERKMLRERKELLNP